MAVELTPLVWRGFCQRPGVWGCEATFRRDGVLVAYRKLMTKSDLKAGALRYVLRDIERTMNRERAKALH